MAEQRPGIMIRFSSLEAIKLLSAEDAGRLFVGLLEYGQSGTEPEGFDGALKIVWSFLRPEIDADGERYHEKILQSRYAAYCREVKRKGETPADFDTWKSSGDIDRCVPMSGDIQYNNNSNSSQSNINLNTKQEQLQYSGGAAQPPPTPARDENGLIFLSDKDYQELEAELGAAELQRVITYLSSYCRLHGKTYPDWPFAIRKAAHEGWGKPVPGKGAPKGIQPGVDLQPDTKRIQQHNDWIDAFLEEQRRKEAASVGK